MLGGSAENGDVNADRQPRHSAPGEDASSPHEYEHLHPLAPPHRYFDVGPTRCNVLAMGRKLRPDHMSMWHNKAPTWRLGLVPHMKPWQLMVEL